MGQPSGAVVGISHILSLLVGFFSGRQGIEVERLERLVQIAVRDSAEQAREICSETCALKEPGSATEVCLQSNWRLQATLSVVVGSWLLSLVALCWWCLQSRATVVSSATPSEDLSPSSAADRKALARAQLAEVRARRHGLGQ